MRRKLIINRKRKNRKNVSVLAPKWPSMSFIESFHNFKLRTEFRMNVFALVLHKPIKCTPRFQRFVPIRWLFSFTMFSTFDFIWRLIYNDWGRARRILLKEKNCSLFSPAAPELSNLMKKKNKNRTYFRICAAVALSSNKYSYCSISWTKCSSSDSPSAIRWSWPSSDNAVGTKNRNSLSHNISNKNEFFSKLTFL